MLAKLAARARQFFSHVAVRNALLLYTVQIGSYVFPFITLSYLTRALSPEKIGLMSLAMNFMWMFNTLTEYGFGLTATRQIAVEKDSPETVNRIFNSVMLAKGLLTAIGFVVMMTCVVSIPNYRAHWVLFPISFLTVVGAWLFPTWLYQGMQKMGQVAARDFISKLLATGIILLVVHKESDYILAALIQSGAPVVSGAISLAFAPKVCGVKFAWRPWRDVAEALRLGWTVFLSMAALAITFSANMFILSFLTTAPELAFFSTAYRLIVAVRMLVSPIVTALYPHLSHMASRSAGGTVAFLKRYSVVLAAPFLAMSLFVFIFAPFIVHRFFGTRYDYTPSILLLRIMAFSPFCLALTHSYTTYFMLAFGFEKQWMRMIVGSTVLNFVFIAITLQFMRPINAFAAVNTAVDVFALLVSYLFYRRHSVRVASQVMPSAA